MLSYDSVAESVPSTVWNITEDTLELVEINTDLYATKHQKEKKENITSPAKVVDDGETTIELVAVNNLDGSLVAVNCYGPHFLANTPVQLLPRKIARPKSPHRLANSPMQSLLSKISRPKSPAAAAASAATGTSMELSHQTENNYSIAVRPSPPILKIRIIDETERRGGNNNKKQQARATSSDGISDAVTIDEDISYLPTTPSAEKQKTSIATGTSMKLSHQTANYLSIATRSSPPILKTRIIDETERRGGNNIKKQQSRATSSDGKSDAVTIDGNISYSLTTPNAEKQKVTTPEIVPTEKRQFSGKIYPAVAADAATPRIVAIEKRQFPGKIYPAVVAADAAATISSSSPLLSSPPVVPASSSLTCDRENVVAVVAEEQTTIPSEEGVEKEQLRSGDEEEIKTIAVPFASTTDVIDNNNAESQGDGDDISVVRSPFSKKSIDQKYHKLLDDNNQSIIDNKYRFENPQELDNKSSPDNVRNCEGACGEQRDDIDSVTSTTVFKSPKSKIRKQSGVDSSSIIVSLSTLDTTELVPVVQIMRPPIKIEPLLVRNKDKRNELAWKRCAPRNQLNKETKLVADFPITRILSDDNKNKGTGFMSMLTGGLAATPPLFWETIVQGKLPSQANESK